MHRLLRTSAIRLSLRYALLYIFISSGGLAFLYWSVSHYVSAQLQADLQHHLDAYTNLYARDGAGAITRRLESRVFDANSRDHRYLLYVDKSGRRIAGDLKGWPSGITADRQVKNIRVEDDLIPRAMEDHDGYWPSIATRFDDGSKLLITQSVRGAENLREFILGILFATLAMIVGLTLILGWSMGRQMLARIDQVNSTAARILHGHLERRIPVTESGDEFDELAHNLNAMLDHIDRLVSGMRRVTDDVAHDLRRPLARLRNRLDVTLLEQRDSATYRQSLEETREDVEDVLKTFNALLEIAQAESGHFRGVMEYLDFSALASELAEMYSVYLAQQGQSLASRIEQGIRVYGNRQLLAQLISNLIENAHKYAGSAARVKLELRREGSNVLLSVADNGPGIPEERFDDVVLRFVRLDSARSSAGSGLGLSLVKAIAQLHGAELTLEDNAPGLRVTLRYSGSTDNGGPWPRGRNLVATPATTVGNP